MYKVIQEDLPILYGTCREGIAWFWDHFGTNNVTVFSSGNILLKANNNSPQVIHLIISPFQTDASDLHTLHSRTGHNDLLWWPDSEPDSNAQRWFWTADRLGVCLCRPAFTSGDGRHRNRPPQRHLPHLWRYCSLICNRHCLITGICAHLILHMHDKVNSFRCALYILHQIVWIWRSPRKWISCKSLYLRL